MKLRKKSLRRQMRSYTEKMGQQLLAEFQQAGTDQTIPGELDEKCLTLLDAVRDTPKKEGQLQWLKPLAAAAAGIALTVAVFLTFFIPQAGAARLENMPDAPVLSYAYTQDAGHYYFRFHTQEPTQKHDPDAVREILDQYTPDGYTLFGEVILVDLPYTPVEFNHFRFVNDQGEYCWLTVEKPNGITTVQKNGQTMTEMNYLGYDCIFLEGKDGACQLLWVDAEEALRYHLYASALPKEEFWALAYQLALSGAEGG